MEQGRGYISVSFFAWSVNCRRRHTLCSITRGQVQLRGKFVLNNSSDALLLASRAMQTSKRPWNIWYIPHDAQKFQKTFWSRTKNAYGRCRPSLCHPWWFRLTATYSQNFGNIFASYRTYRTGSYRFLRVMQGKASNHGT